MLPHFVHMVPRKHVQIINPANSKLTLQNKAVVNVKRQHESMQKDMPGSNLRWLNKQAASPQPSR